jgi:hypothetical protein
VLRRLSHGRSISQRAIYIASVCFISSYIALDVLALDESSFPALVATIERSSVLAVIPSQVEICYSPNAVEHSQIIATLLDHRLKNYFRLRMTKLTPTL